MPDEQKNPPSPVPPADPALTTGERGQGLDHLLRAHAASTGLAASTAATQQAVRIAASDSTNTGAPVFPEPATLAILTKQVGFWDVFAEIERVDGVFEYLVEHRACQHIGRLILSIRTGIALREYVRTHPECEPDDMWMSSQAIASEVLATALPSVLNAPPTHRG